MSSRIKAIILVPSMFAMSACASVFSSYESDFSCKNSDFGNCESPMQAYNRAIGAHTDPAAQVVTPDGEHDHHHAEKQTDFEGYQNAVYGEVAELVKEPDTPILVAPKTVRTLVMPYSDPNKSDRLYMPRYVYSILEDSKFVLGNYLKPQNPVGGFRDLLNSMGATVEVKEE